MKPHEIGTGWKMEIRMTDRYEDLVDDQGRALLHNRPLPPIGPAKPIPAEKPPETQCSECGIGPGADHLKHCRRGRRRYHPMNPRGF